ncbi:MAG: FAD-dependent oxidoreductase [Chloroflexi bacterium]|nr:FAD-dependent oxidoreductase [Chloroflexota bacterium]
MNVAVLGAGLAGLACAVELAERGHGVTLFERRPWAGGKTYSFRERETGELVDNGQHVFLACTTAYIAFLRKLGTLGLTVRQRRLRVPVYDERGRRAGLWSAPLPAPLHLAPALLSYRHLSVRDRLRVARAAANAGRMSEAERRALDGTSFAGWLREHGQTDAAIRDFWDFVIVPTLNCRSEEASAAAALFVLREGFLSAPDASAIGVPRAGLSALHVEPALRLLERHGAAVRLSCAVEQIDARDGAVEGVALSSGAWEAFDAYVSALPHTALLDLLPAGVRAEAPFAGLARMTTAPIVNLHVWFDRAVAPFEFAAFARSELQWVFNRTRLAREDMSGGEHLVVSLSAAEAYADLTKEQLKARFVPLLRRALPPARAAQVVRFVAVKEPEATFVAAPGTEALRPGPRTPLRNLFLAGAWTATGWPATMESAVRSGVAAARAVEVMPRPTLEPAAAAV